MARNRMIKPEFWEDEKMSEVTCFARLFFISLWTFADDYGYLRNNLKWLKVKCFPYDDINIEKLTTELENIGVISLKNEIIKITNFSKHQTINKKFKSDLPNLYNGKDIEKSTQKGNDVEQVMNKSCTGSEQVKDLSLQEVKRKEEEKEVEVEEEKESTTFPFSQKQTTNDKDNCDKTANKDIPKKFKDLVDYLVSCGYEQDKAELVASLCQSIGFELTDEHIKIFKAQTSDEIKSSFDSLAKVKALTNGGKKGFKKENGFSTFSG